MISYIHFWAEFHTGHIILAAFLIAFIVFVFNFLITGVNNGDD